MFYTNNIQPTVHRMQHYLSYMLLYNTCSVSVVMNAYIMTLLIYRQYARNHHEVAPCNLSYYVTLVSIHLEMIHNDDVGLYKLKYLQGN